VNEYFTEFGKSKFHLLSYASSTRTGILHWPNPDEEDEEGVISAEKVTPGN
jgi:hypothetical protein